jgi:hypothetical protein
MALGDLGESILPKMLLDSVPQKAFEICAFRMVRGQNRLFGRRFLATDFPDFHGWEFRFFYPRHPRHPRFPPARGGIN